MEQRQIELQFDADKHIYSDKTGTIYTSATTLIGKYKPKFDEKYWSMYVALRDAGFKLRPNPEKQVIQVDGVYRSLDSLYKHPINNHEVKRVIRKWKMLTEVACDRGNEIHDYLEDSINESKGDTGESNKEIKPSLSSALAKKGLEIKIETVHDLNKTTIRDRFPEIYNRLLLYIKNDCIIYAEKKIYSTQFEIAGMIDVLIVKRGTKLFAILDWKTNKDIMMFRSGYFKKEKIKGKYVKTDNFIEKKSYLFPPLNKVEECKGMIYTLQLSLYAYIMELWGYKLVNGGLEIFHMRPNLKPKLIKIAYKKREIELMLEHHYNTRVTVTNKQPQLQSKFSIN